MATVQIQKLMHEVQNTQFDCGNPSVDSQVIQSYFLTLLQHMYAFEIKVDASPVGYYMIRFRNISLSSLPEEVSDFSCDLAPKCGSVHIQYIAVAKKFQGKGIGTVALKVIIGYVRELCKSWPVRLITLDAINDKYEWYRRLGFLPFSEDELKMGKSTIAMYMDMLIEKTALESYCADAQ